MDFKKIIIIVNSILGAAVIALFVLFFTSNKNCCPASQEPSVHAVSGNLNIAYVNIDSLLAKYDMYFDMKKQLEGKEKKLSAELEVKTKSYEQKVAEYQDKVNKGLITRSKAQEIEQELYGEQQKLLKMRDEMSGSFSEEQQVMNRQMLNSITEYLKVYNKDGRYTYILSHSYLGNLLYVNDSLDITADVIKGLNESYAKSK